MLRASGRLKDLRRNCAGNSTGLSTCRPNGLLPRRFVPSGLCSRSDRIGAFASERPCSGRACSGEACSIRFDLRQGSVRRIPHPAVFLCRTPCRLCRRNALRARFYNVPRISYCPAHRAQMHAHPALLCAAPRTALDLRAAIAFDENDPVPGVHAPGRSVRSVSICGRVQSGVPRCPVRLCGLYFCGMEYFSGAFPFRLAGNWAGPVLRLRMQKPFCAEKNPACAGHSGAGGGR